METAVRNNEVHRNGLGIQIRRNAGDELGWNHESGTGHGDGDRRAAGG